MGKNGIVFRNTLLAIISLEIASFIAYSNPGMNPWIFSIASIAIITATVCKLEWGAYLIFTELAIGSFGKLFVLQVGGVELSIRIVLWLIVMSVWLSCAARTRQVAFFHSRFFKPYLILA